MKQDSNAMRLITLEMDASLSRDISNAFLASSIFNDTKEERQLEIFIHLFAKNDFKTIWRLRKYY